MKPENIQNDRNSLNLSSEMNGTFGILPIRDARRDLPVLLVFGSHLKRIIVTYWEEIGTFLGGECITGAGGEGGARGIFWLILKKTTIIEPFLDKF